MQAHGLGCDAEGRMQRVVSEPWVWVSPVLPEQTYAVMRWKGGALYAGPADSAVNFPPALIDQASMLICSRADALRHAIAGKVEA